MNIALAVSIFVVIGVAMLFRQAAHFPYRDDDNDQPVTVAEDWKTAVSLRERAFLVAILATVAVASVIIYPKMRALRKQSMTGVSR